ncbi:MAG: glycosyl transferase, partial [Eubacteriales bacterium]|nr:glycosyl transferase [Eubacteriales bacterium]
RERWDHYAYDGVNAPISGFDTQRETFLGRVGDWIAPEQVMQEKSSGSVAHGWAPIAALRMDVTLAPGEARTFVFTLGYGKNPRDDKWEQPGVIKKTDAKRVLQAYADPCAVTKALEKLSAYWDALLSRYHVESSDPKMDRMVNIWNQYQCMVTFNMSRSASYYESGTGRGMGFRDSCQDLLGFLHLIPARARERIIDIASIQFEDGSTYHQYQPLNKRGNGDVGSGFNDDPLWLVACTVAYIKETGDHAILQAPVPFNNVVGSEQPLFEHLRRSVNYTIDHRGPHKLPLIGRADWNDCLNLNCFSNEPGESFQTCANFESGIAESVFIAGMFVKYGLEYAALCRRYGNAAEAVPVEAAVKEMEEAVLKAGWDGKWFLRAYDAFGKKIGSSECEEGQIFIEPQGFCVMAGIGVEGGQAKMALDSVSERLVGEYGIELLAPCYTVYHEELGEISSYPPGYKENGSVFCHNNTWVSIAHTVIGNGDAAFDLYRRICPAYLEDKSEVHRCEPYVYAQTVAGRASFSEGEAKNSWLSGTAAWTFVNISQSILGIQPDFDGLCVNPCLPAELTGYKLTRIYRGVQYNITVKRTGTASMTVDGKAVAGNMIPYDKSKSVCTVEVTI